VCPRDFKPCKNLVLSFIDKRFDDGKFKVWRGYREFRYDFQFPIKCRFTARVRNSHINFFRLDMSFPSSSASTGLVLSHFMNLFLRSRSCSRFIFDKFVTRRSGMETYFNKEDAGLITCTPRTYRSSTSRAVPPQKFVTMAGGLSRLRIIRLMKSRENNRNTRVAEYRSKSVLL
jgi:hypothetical protein